MPIYEHNELVQQAVSYIAEQRVRRPEEHLDALLDEAGMRFSLTPLDSLKLREVFASAATEPQTQKTPKDVA